MDHRNVSLSGERVTLVASRNNDDSWTIEQVDPAPSGGGGQPPQPPPQPPGTDDPPTPAPGPGVGADDHGDTPLGASWLPFGYPVEGMLEDRDDVDAFRFDLQGRAIARVRARGNLDTVGTLVDSAGSLVRESDDAGGNLNFTLRARLEPGTYYVLVESDNDVGAYSLLASFERDDDHGDTALNSTPMPLGKWLSGLAEDGDDVDAFRFDLPVATGVRVTTRGPSDTHATLRDAAGDVVERSRDGGAGDNFLIDRSLDAGIHYVEVGASARGNYALRVEADDDGLSCPVPDGPEDPPDEEPEQPPDPVGRYGAISVDFKVSQSCPGLAAAIAVGHPTQAEARTAARRACRADGGSESECRTETEVFTQCGALAYGTTATGCIANVVGGPAYRSTSAAESGALSACRSRGATCRIFVNNSGQRISGCSSLSAGSATSASTEAASGSSFSVREARHKVHGIPNGARR